MTPETADDGWIYGGPERHREGGESPHMNPAPDDCDRIADEIALMLDPTRYADEDLPGMTPEIRAARRRITARYDELKVKLPFLDSARRARAEVVADWLKRRLQDG